jgi:tRNA(fMet)-specific endonuclease VapC
MSLLIQAFIRRERLKRNAFYFRYGSHVSLLLRGDVRLRGMVDRVGDDVGTTVITVQELFNGWIVRINSASPTDDFVGLYEQLWRSVTHLQNSHILKFDRGADYCFWQLLQQNPELRKARLQRDIRIAAIALSLDATVVTRNQTDFVLVPGLTIVDWTEQ